MKPILAIGLGLVLAPAPASAQDAAPNDPKAGSPSGTVYEIPFEAGRNDAAPRRRHSGQGTGAVGTSGGAAPSAGSTPIRSSDNGFGSSSVVPGADTGSSGASKRGDGGKSRSKDRGTGRQKGATGASVTDAASAETLIRPASAGGTGTPSLTRSLLLLGLGVVVAVALGLGARRTSRGR